MEISNWWKSSQIKISEEIIVNYATINMIYFDVTSHNVRNSPYKIL